MKYQFKGDQNWLALASYFMQLLGKHFEVPVDRVEQDAEVSIGTHKDCDLQITPSFIDLIKSKTYNHEKWFTDRPILMHQDSSDLIGTILYMINSVQEFYSENLDQYKRFDFQFSYQEKFDCFEDDLVSNYFEILRSEKLSDFIVKPKSKKSRIFLSHDIDKVSSAFKTETIHALRSLNWSVLINYAVKAINNEFGWDDFEGIINKHKQLGFSTGFFWLTEKGPGKEGIYNADYSFVEGISAESLIEISSSSCFSGLHKSSSDKTFDEEYVKLNYQAPVNRNHFFKIQLPYFYDEIEKSPILLDSSLGLSKSIGFRNSYARAFIPFDFESNKPFQFVEYPLQIMDVSLCIHMYNSPQEAWPRVEQFLEQHQYNCDLSLLWHNQYLTNGVYKDWAELYDKILKKLVQLKIRSTSPIEILQDFGIEMNASTPNP